MTQFQDKFYKVCHNECFARSRDMYPDLGYCIHFLLHTPPENYYENFVEELDRFEKPYLVRALYLIKILLQRMPCAYQSIWTAWLNKHQNIRAEEADNLAFFHADSIGITHPTNDATAIKLGLVKGLERSKIKQLIDQGTA
ncbi:hypothetical protein Q9L42_020795 (plasmid) [Methylomarinum sp. Ch1-1]|uniref:Uncharacterized protein n=1 Tax=Methylomarinum roseum TaxID=3067653 RepID=A0AAU7P081_9GAMM|nr:hypothetical protein [Methylomarinum sp. Ch1-1]MDP4518960.1 hypothetical protein [Methylomarinum sp. Ch1-1]MDP4523358.1 hypothetical protein [Methylomarinum sp. Ch1-1]